MADFLLQRALREFYRNETLENAKRFFRLWEHSTKSINIDPLEDMEICAFYLGNLIGFEEDHAYDTSDEYSYIVNWIETFASFNRTSANIWENIIYINPLKEEEEITVENFKEDPTPTPLIPIIEQAVELGFSYISFYV